MKQNRKRLKQKRLSCALRKPYKTGWAHRFKSREGLERRLVLREIREAGLSW